MVKHSKHLLPELGSAPELAGFCQWHTKKNPRLSCGYQPVEIGIGTVEHLGEVKKPPAAALEFLDRLQHR